MTRNKNLLALCIALSMMVLWTAAGFAGEPATEKPVAPTEQTAPVEKAEDPALAEEPEAQGDGKAEEQPPAEEPAGVTGDKTAQPEPPAKPQRPPSWLSISKGGKLIVDHSRAAGEHVKLVTLKDIAGVPSVRLYFVYKADGTPSTVIMTDLNDIAFIASGYPYPSRR